MSAPKYLPRHQVPKHLLEKYGEPAVVTAATLAKLAVNGGGPPFTKFGRKVGYEVEELDRWVVERGRNFRSTSEAG
jgi:hypothetical protein